MSRTVRDSALLLQVMAGYDPRDVSSLREPVPDFVSATERGIEGLRIGWSADFGYTPVDPEVAQVSEAGARAFEELGCSVDESALELDTPFDAWIVFFGGNAYTVNGHLLDDPDDPAVLVRALEYRAGREFHRRRLRPRVGAARPDDSELPGRV